MTEYHADDYGLFPEQSRTIIDCYHNGALNGISIMPNSPYLKECMLAIDDIRGKLSVAVHLNLTEGKPLTKGRASALVNKDGNFNIGFVRLLIIGCIPVLRLKYKRQIKNELEAQIKACEPYMNGEVYRLDAHEHYHMLPIVFDAMMQIVRDNSLKVSYIRFPREEISVYQKAGKLSKTKLINLIKVFVLNSLSLRNERKYAEELTALKLERKLFMGVMLSGHMFYEDVKECLVPAAEMMTDRGIYGLEILFHPGGVDAPEDIARLTGRGDISFLTSNNRKKEAEALKKFGGNLRR